MKTKGLKRRFRLDDLVYLLLRTTPGCCPCGWTWQASAGQAISGTTISWVGITKEGRTRYHKRLAEIDYVQEGRGRIELNGRGVTLQPHTEVLLLLLRTCHRVVGRLNILNLASPQFDPKDEYFD